MRTNIDLDDELLSEAMTATGLPTKRATVEEALRNLYPDSLITRKIWLVKVLKGDSN